MPYIDLDYSSTIIYKITCKDSAITDVYVGHTTNFVQRNHAHRCNCINPNSANKKLKLYEVIRANGGWNNWKMEIINFFECKNQSEARQKEQEYFISLNATLNSIEPFPTQKIKAIVPLIKEVEKKDTSSLKFICTLCKTETNNKKDFNKHLLTNKHMIRFNQKQLEEKSTEKNSLLKCSTCDKLYQTRSGLWKHRNSCDVIKHKSNTVVIPEPQITCSNETNMLVNLISDAIKSNNESMKQYTEIQKQYTETQKQIIDLLYKNNNLTV